MILFGFFIVVAASSLFCFFFFNDTATTEIYTLSLHDALPISPLSWLKIPVAGAILRDLHPAGWRNWQTHRSEEHTSELQSPDHLVCRLLLEKKKLFTRSAVFNFSRSSRCNI